MAEVKVMSYAHGNQLRDMTGSTPGDIAQELELSLSGVAIYVGSSEAKVDTSLADGNIVSFQRAKVTSGK